MSEVDIAVEVCNLIETLQLGIRSIVVKRPHFRRSGNDLFFLVSRRPFARLSGSEARLWDAIHQETPLEELHHRFNAQAASGIRRLVELGTCELVPQPCEHWRRRVLVIEPHSDDAVLSVGGTMWLSRNVCQFTIATIASRSNFTSYFYTLDRDFFDIDTVSSLRTAEGSVAARLLGGRYLPLGQAEATVRYRDTRWTLDSFRNHQLSIRVATGRIYGEAELRDWTSAITKLLREQEADEVWMPLGVGVHCDHQLARDACLDALIAEPSLFDNRTVKFYQEVPYGARNPNYTSKVVAALERGGASLVPESVPIDEVFDQKLRVISIYGSQFKLDVLRPEIESNARMAGGAAHMAELFWRLDAAPKKRDRLSMYVHEEAVRKTMPRLSSWCSRHRSSKRIRIMLLVPSGKWAMDADQLLRLFPRATFDVYVSSAGLAEVNEVPSPRIRARRVGMGMKAWGSLAAKLVVARPMPTLFVTGAKRLTIGRALRLLWPLNDTVVLPSMDYVVLGLRRPIDYKPL